LHAADIGIITEKVAADKNFNLREFISKNFALLFKFGNNCPSLIPEILKKLKFFEEINRFRGPQMMIHLLLNLLQVGS